MCWVLPKGSRCREERDFQGTEKLEEVPPEEGAGATEGQTVFVRAERWGHEGDGPPRQDAAGPPDVGRPDASSHIQAKLQKATVCRQRGHGMMFFISARHGDGEPVAGGQVGR